MNQKTGIVPIRRIGQDHRAKNVKMLAHLNKARIHPDVQVLRNLQEIIVDTNHPVRIVQILVPIQQNYYKNWRVNVSKKLSIGNEKKKN